MRTLGDAVAHFRLVCACAEAAGRNEDLDGILEHGKQSPRWPRRAGKSRPALGILFFEFNKSTFWIQFYRARPCPQQTALEPKDGLPRSCAAC
ncbi:hypothetical protein WQQ_06690 [Hydrocarboniphaga effusa AP103]|uniref:Uncharacterized protein n=1 Tax=Hydrocarboniphaga effusa AP103 TaxID=1172194 RepID=I7ZFR6_9GAMM|nr:hypothetical protein WQQ_06690 [Hydrocarboniphaga effusa AP103]